MLKVPRKGDYVSVRLPIHGGDPQEGCFGLEKHKARIPIDKDLLHTYAYAPDAVVVSREGLVVEDSDGNLFRLHFGARLHGLNLENGTFCLGKGDSRKNYNVIGGKSAIEANTGEACFIGITIKEFARRVRVFEGTNFAWGGIGPESSDASGWYANLLHSYSILVPHNTRRMEQYFRQDGTRRVERFTELQAGDVVFCGPKGRDKPVNYLGLVDLLDDDREVCMWHVRGKGGWQGNSLLATSQLLSETEIQGWPDLEIKSVFRPLQLEK